MRPDGKAIAAACGKYDKGELLVWDVESGQIVMNVSRSSRSVSYTPDSKHLITAAINGEIAVIDAASGHIVRNIGHGGKVVVSNDGKLIATASGAFRKAPGDVSIIEVDTGRTVRQFKEDQFEVSCVTISKGNDLVAYGTKADSLATRSPVRVMDLQSGKTIAVIPANLSWVHAVAFSPDGAWLAIGGIGGGVSIWDIRPLIEKR